MIQVTEAESTDGSVRTHVFPEATRFDTGRHGELLVFGPASADEPHGRTVGAFAEGAWDVVLVDPPTGGQLVSLPPTGSSGPSTIGPSTFSQPPAAGPLENPADPGIPGGSLSEQADLVGASSVMTAESPGEFAGGDAFGSGAGEQPPAAPAPDPGLPVDENTKVVLDGQGQPLVLKKVTRPDGSTTWAQVSPDDIPAGVPPALIEEPAPAQQ
jgi:hypothetical protein